MRVRAEGTPDGLRAPFLSGRPLLGAEVEAEGDGRLGNVITHHVRSAGVACDDEPFTS